MAGEIRLGRKRKLPPPELQRLMADPTISVSCLARVARALRDCPEPAWEDLANRKLMSRALHADFEGVSATLTLTKVDNSVHSLAICDPHLLLAEMVQVSGELAEIYGNIANTHGCGPDNPWNLILGFDEFTPGAALKPLNTKKVMVVSFNFAELGQRLLSRADTWMTPLIIRHTA